VILGVVLCVVTLSEKTESSLTAIVDERYRDITAAMIKIRRRATIDSH